MSKSVLVIDTPENCRKCPLHSVDSFSIYCKAVTDDCGWCSPARKICDRNEKCVKPYWCPLSPLPEKIDLDKYFMRGDCKSMTHMVMNIHDHGWNDCIDEILKGKE
jgi:hypothetical protein